MSMDPCPLSKRELEVLRLVATGATNQQIARELTISPNTVKVHLRNIFDKLGVASRTEATMLAVQAGWLTVEGLSPAPARETSRPIPHLQPWQRVYLIVVVIITALAVAWPLGGSVRLGAQLDPFTDQGYPSTGTIPWRDVPRWEVRATLPRPRARLALVAYDGRLYAIGGEGPEGVTGAVYAYDPAENRWSPQARKPTPVSNLGAAVLGGKIYAIGGCAPDGRATDVLEVYDPIRDVWTTRQPLPAPRCAHAVAVADGRLYVFGGWDNERYVDDVLVYDPAADSWKRGAPMPTPRGFLGAAELKGYIYIVGGYDGRREYVMAHRYDPKADARGEPAWEEIPSMMAPRGGLALVAEGIALYAIGGGWRGGLEYNERFDPLSNTWSRVDSPFEIQWRNLGAAVLGPRIYVVGGWGGDYMGVTAVYQSSFRTFLPLGSRNVTP